MEVPVLSSNHAPTKSDPIDIGLLSIQHTDDKVHDAPSEVASPKPDLRRAYTVAKDKDVSKRNAAAKLTTQNLAGNLLRVKDSDELLQRRCLRRSQARRPPRDAFAAVREAKNCTVANVGNNGTIYLRYASNYVLMEKHLCGHSNNSLLCS